MSSLPITPPGKARVDAAPRSSAPPTGSALGDFAALLTQTSARTAPAEGPKTRPAHGDVPRRPAHGDAPRAGAAKARRGAAAPQAHEAADGPAQPRTTEADPAA